MIICSHRVSASANAFLYPFSHVNLAKPYYLYFFCAEKKWKTRVCTIYPFWNINEVVAKTSIILHQDMSIYSTITRWKKMSLWEETGHLSFTLLWSIILHWDLLHLCGMMVWTDLLVLHKFKLLSRYYQ